MWLEKLLAKTAARCIDQAVSRIHLHYPFGNGGCQRLNHLAYFQVNSLPPGRGYHPGKSAFLTKGSEGDRKHRYSSKYPAKHIHGYCAGSVQPDSLAALKSGMPPLQWHRSGYGQNVEIGVLRDLLWMISWPDSLKQLPPAGLDQCFWTRCS